MKSKMTQFILFVTIVLMITPSIYALEHFEWNVTDESMNLFVIAATMNGESLVEDDEFGTFTEDGVCAGGGLIPEGFPDNEARGFAWALDEEHNFGFGDREPLEFRVWDHVEDIEAVAEVEVIAGDLVYRTDSFLAVELTAEGQNDDLPEISINEEEHDFGFVRVEESDDWILEIENVGNADLVISRIQTDSDNFTVNFEEEVSVEANASIEFTVNFTPDTVGMFQAILLIESNADGQEELEILLLGEGFEGDIPPVIAVNPMFIDFGRVAIDATIDREITVSNNGEEDLNIDDVSLEGEYFSSDFGDQIIIEAGDQAILTVSFSPEESGDFAGGLTLQSNDPRNEELVVNLNGIGFRPGEDLYYRFHNTDTNMSILIELAELEGESLDENDEIGIFTEDGLCAGGGLVQADFPDERMGTAAFGSEAGEDNGFQNGERLEFRLYDADADAEGVADIEEIDGSAQYRTNAIIIIRLTAEINEVFPNIMLSDESHDFGVVRVEESDEWQFTVSNLGPDDLHIMSMEMEGDYYSVNFEDEVVIAEDEEREFNVTFAPEEAGVNNANLLITSNDPNDEIVIIELEGTGTDEDVSIIGFETDNLNFGGVAIEEFRVMDLDGWNEGNGVLFIESIEIDGDAFSVEFNNEDGIEVEPGDEFSIPVRFEPAEEREYEGTLTVTSNDEDAQETIINLHGRGIPEGNHFRFLQTSDDMSIVIQEVNLEEGDLEEGDEIGVFTPGDLCVGAVTIEDEWPVGIAAWPDDVLTEEIDGFRQNEEIFWRLWDSEAGREYNARAQYIEGGGFFRVQGFGVVNLFQIVDENQPRIVLDVENHDFRRVLIDNQRSWMMQISNTGNGTLVLENISSDLEVFTTPEFEDGTEIEPDSMVEVEVFFRPAEVQDYAGTLTITSNDPAEEEIEVSLTGSGIEEFPPQIELFAEDHDFGGEDAHNFGEVEIETGSSWNITITNIGGSFLNIEQIALNGEGFSVNPDQDFQIEIDESRILRVTFEPEEEIDYEATLTFSSNDPDNEIIEISLAGVGGRPNYVWDFVETDNNMSVLIGEITLEEDLIPFESQVGVFTEDGICAGVSVIREYPVGVAVWGDDPETEDVVEGFVEDEELFYRIWDSDEEVELMGIPEYIEGEGFYSIDSFSVLTLEAEVVEPDGECDWEYDETDSNHTLLVRSAVIGETPLAVGDYVGVFTQDGLCAGFTELEDSGENQFGLTAWGTEGGDEPNGFRVGEEFEFRFWDVDQERELEAFAEWEDDEGPRVYAVNGITILLLNTEMNHAPVWLEVPEQVDGREGEEITFEVSGEDADGDEVTIEAVFDGFPEDNLPEFEDLGEGRGTFTWTPGNNDAGDYLAVIILSDETHNVPAEVSIFVENGDEGPILVNPIDDVEIGEDSELHEIADLDDVFEDPNGEELAFSFAGAMDELNMEIDENAVLSIEPEPDFNLPDGVEITVIAENEDGWQIEDVFTIVITPINDTPEVQAAIADIEREEDSFDILNIADLDEVFFDVDNDDLDFSFNDEVPENLGMEINEENVLSIDAVPNFNTPDALQITITADDNQGRFAAVRFRISPILQNENSQLSRRESSRSIRSTGGATPNRDDFVEDEFLINIIPVNDAPFWNRVDDQVFLEMQEVEFEISATDVDGDRLALEMTDQGAAEGDFEDNGDNSGLYVWPTEVGDAGDYRLTFTATDEADMQVELVVNLEIRTIIPFITVPTDEDVWEEQIAEDEEIFIEFLADDNDTDIEDLIWSAQSDDIQDIEELFEDLGDGEALFDWTPDFNTAREEAYVAVFTVDDQDGHTDQIRVEITVTNENRAPVIDLPEDADEADIEVDEGAELRFQVRAVDPDGDGIVFTEQGVDDLPGDAVFEFNNGMWFTWTPPYDASSDDPYDVTFIATDDDNDNPLEDRIIVHITVGEFNPRPEVLIEIPDLSVDEDSDPFVVADLDSIFVDPEYPGDETLTYRIEGVPEGVIAELDDQNVLTLSFDFNFNLAAGVVISVFAIEPDFDLDGLDEFTLIVNPVNDSPGNFTLIAPENNYEIDRETFEVEFVWGEALNVDDDEINYTWYFHAQYEDIDTTGQQGGIADTSFSPDDLADRLVDLGIYVEEGEVNIPVQWWIVAEDDSFAVSSEDTFTVIVPVPVTVTDEQVLPLEFGISSNYPNPFNPTTKIRFDLRKSGYAKLSVWSISGQKVTELVNQQMQGGSYEVEWNAESMATGVYFFKLEVDEGVFLTKGLLMR